jgi:signal transduction histidine kinase
VITQLRYFPYVQLGILGLFLLVSYALFSMFRNAEQNQVWVGMAKETAHQLGTPLSSLMAWMELLKSSKRRPLAVTEMRKDVDRLEVITERFSKIGSAPDLTREALPHPARHRALPAPALPARARIEVHHRRCGAAGAAEPRALQLGAGEPDPQRHRCHGGRRAPSPSRSCPKGARCMWM